MSGVHAAIHARQRQLARQEEEEEMTRYTPQDLSQGWEFKIMRSATGAFSDPDTLQRMLAEESASGWTLVEKFDDQRVRLKRPAGARRREAPLPPGVDPYRTRHGISEGQLAAMIVVAVTGLAGIGVLLAALLSG